MLQEAHSQRLSLSLHLSVSLSLALMLLLSSSPSASLPPIFPPAAVSLLINFSLLTRAQSCSSPQPASETALRSALAAASQPQRLVSARIAFGFKSVLKVGLSP